jgi:hypothetical protein
VLSLGAGQFTSGDLLTSGDATLESLGMNVEAQGVSFLESETSLATQETGNSPGEAKGHSGANVDGGRTCATDS